MIRRSGSPGMDYSDTAIYPGVFKWVRKGTRQNTGNDRVAASGRICIYIYGNYETGRQICKWCAKFN